MKFSFFIKVFFALLFICGLQIFVLKNVAPVAHAELNAACTVDADCDSGFHCDRSGGQEPSCQEGKPAGTECALDTECAPGLRCDKPSGQDFGTCEVPVAVPLSTPTPNTPTQTKTEPASTADHLSYLIVRCKGDGTDKTLIPGTTEHECRFPDVIAEIKLLINFVFLLSVPVTVAAIAWSGIQILLAQGNAGKLSDVKKRLVSILKGFLFVLGGWLLVYTIANFLLKPEYYTPFLGGNSGTSNSSTLKQ